VRELLQDAAPPFGVDDEQLVAVAFAQCGRRQKEVSHKEKASE
jgi:hypothetical protein